MLLLMSLGSRKSRIDPSCLETRTTLLIQSTHVPELVQRFPNCTIFEARLCMLISSSQVLLEVDDVQVLRLTWAKCGICPNPPPYISLNWDNTYSFAMGKQCLFSFRKIASSNNSDVGLVTFLESGCRALTLVWICGVLLKEGGVTSRKAM